MSIDQQGPSEVIRVGRDAGELILHCPKCGWECVHITTVAVAARSEDDPERTVIVDPYSGDVAAGKLAPFGTPPDSERRDRRHRVALHVDCEQGCRSWLVLTQHKGNTYVSVDSEAPTLAAP